VINGGNYILSFVAKASSPKTINARIQKNGGDYKAYSLNNFDITEEEKEYSFEFTMNDTTDLSPRLAFNMGFFEDDQTEFPVTITITNVSIILKNEVFEEMAKTNSINLNQLGFLPNQRKTAFFKGDTITDNFSVINEAGEKVYDGEITRRLNNLTAGEFTYIGDFSSITSVGKYRIVAEGLGESYPFEIGENIFADAFKAINKMFLLQRCGCELSEAEAGIYAHEICHNEKARIHGTNDKFLDVSGGWHDAGDYGRYVVAGAKAVADLLLAYKACPEVFENLENIKDNANGVPFILDEVKYELDWMFKMQNSEGGVYHKVTCLNFPGFVMPEYETDLLYVCPVSTCATGDFAAVMAMAYEIYLDIDKAYADKCLSASKKAYDYLLKTKSNGFKNPGTVVTGEYGDSDDNDERYWAACALFSATKEEKYHNKAKELFKDSYAKDLGWEDIGGYGNVVYLLMNKNDTDKDFREKVENSLISVADSLVENAKKDGYHAAIDKYVWGSNMIIADNAMLMLIANDISPKKDYIDFAFAQCDYIFGANPMSTSYVTGFGTVSPENPHHRPSAARKQATPGMLVGGPDEGLHDDFAKTALEGSYPAKCFIDHEQSYSTNEITIYWNSPLVYVMARLGLV